MIEEDTAHRNYLRDKYIQIRQQYRVGRNQYSVWLKIGHRSFVLPLNGIPTR